MDPRLARAVWHRLEAMNAVTYFEPECREVPVQRGLKGFWMGYFAGRAAPMGPVNPAVVEATFFNFHPARIRRAIPDAWAHVEPVDLVVARSAAAASALRRLLADRTAEETASTVLPILDAVAASASSAGRPLFAANRELALPADPVAALWQGATTLREHRGDGHVALLTGAGLDGCEVHVLFSACRDITPALFQESRGWSPEDWDGATERLQIRGLLARDALPSALGRDLHEEIERRTDELAVAPYNHVGDQRVEELMEYLAPVTARLAARSVIPYPNPMGLPPPDLR